MIAAVLVALGWLVLLPDPLHAWGPGTHVALGESVLAALWMLPPAVRALLERFPIHFLYGSVAADISLAKKYVPEGRHCHHWPVGEEVLRSADEGLWTMRGERHYVVADGFDTGAELVDTVSGWYGARVPADLERRLASAGPAQVHQEVRMRLLEAA